MMQPDKTMDYRKELAEARKAVKNLPRNGAGTTIDAYWEVCCGDVLVAEENLREQRRSWENTALVKEFLDIAQYLEGFDHLLDRLNQACKRMEDVIFGHPSLKLKLLNFRLSVLSRIESINDHDLGESEDVMDMIRFYGSNMERADRGEFDAIEQRGSLKSDPIEWSAEYESNIDEVERIVDGMLSDHPRGMGFCHAYWSAKAYVLEERFGIVWRSPAVMNPGVLFD